jgi:hypothetical protein
MEEYNWSHEYAAFRIVGEIMKAEKKTMGQYSREEIFDMLARVSAALKGAASPSATPAKS